MVESNSEIKQKNTFNTKTHEEIQSIISEIKTYEKIFENNDSIINQEFTEIKEIPEFISVEEEEEIPEFTPLEKKPVQKENSLVNDQIISDKEIKEKKIVPQEIEDVKEKTPKKLKEKKSTPGTIFKFEITENGKLINPDLNKPKKKPAEVKTSESEELTKLSKLKNSLKKIKKIIPSKED